MFDLCTLLFKNLLYGLNSKDYVSKFIQFIIITFNFKLFIYITI